MTTDKMVVKSISKAVKERRKSWQEIKKKRLDRKKERNKERGDGICFVESI
jgi:hypothetical protein